MGRTHRAKPAGVSLVTPLHGRVALQVFAFTAAAAVMLVSVVAPNPPDKAMAEASGDAVLADSAQRLLVVGNYTAAVARDSYQATKKPAPTVREAPAAGVPDPGSAKAIAYDMVAARGWGVGEYDCLVSLWNKESGWNVYAHNSSSGAYGIPQALPGSKMGSAGADWATNPATQITWGLSYISGRYQTPCGAWNASLAKGWY